MKKILILLFLLVVLIASGIGVYHHKHRVITYDDSDVGPGGNAASIARLRDIHEYLLKNNYMDRFGYLTNQYRNDMYVNERRGILLNLYEKGFFNNEDFSRDNATACTAGDYEAGIQTMTFLGRLLTEYTDGQQNCDEKMARQMVASLTVWAASFPKGFLMGNEGIIRLDCAMLNNRLLE